MKPSSQGPGWQSTPLFVVALLLAAGAYWATGPLGDPRPRQSGTAGHVLSKVDSIPTVDARLWQDPFGPVWRYDDKHPSAASDTELKRVADAKCGSSDRCVVLGVMAAGGPYVGTEEHRRAMRYAVLAGLQQRIGSTVGGFLPEDSEHIRYVKIVRGNLKTTVPFEWFQTAKGDRHLLLLWLDEEAFAAPGDSVVERLGELFGKFSDEKRYRLALLGPTSSGTLQAMACPGDGAEPRRILARVQIYSAYATSMKAWNSVMSGEGCANRRPADLRITRVNSTDGKLVDLLVDELALYRRVGESGPEDTVLLVAQRDTAYSRDLVDNFRARLDQKKIRVEVAYHLRGIDGQLPTTDKPADSGAKKDKDGKMDKTAIERPEGDAQTDYLRRLAADWANPHNHEGARIRAVGVVGNDYYDKLLVLKALRPALPGAVFFTTDLNAAMLNPEDNQFTRGMLVASGFGLSLDPAIQNGVAPFRTNYQAATYLATRVAMENALSPGGADRPVIAQQDIDQRLPPMLFEIGRNTPVPLCVDPADPMCGKRVSAGAGDNDWRNLPVWQPVPNSSRSPRYWIGMASAVVAAILLPILLFTTVRLFVVEYRYLLGGVAIAAVAFVAYIGLHMPRPLDEPFSWLEGISVWPTEILRAAAIVLTLFFIYHGIKKLSDSDARTAKLFRLPAGASRPQSQSQDSRGLCNLWWLYQARGIAVSKLDRHLDQREPENAPPWGWRTVLRQTGARVLVYLALGFGLFAMSGAAAPPARGAAITLDFILLRVVVVLFPFLLFFVLDASRRATWLARRLTETDSWPPETLEEFGLPLEQQSRYFDHWLDVRLIATATAETGKLVYYPFAVFFLMLVARSPLFDTWSFSLPLIAVFCLAIVLMLTAGVRLRREAERVRSGALHDLEDVLLRIQGRPGNEALEKQIKTMIERIHNIRTGAFLPFAQQPLVRAILGVVSGASGLALLEYASLANL